MDASRSKQEPLFFENKSLLSYTYYNIVSHPVKVETYGRNLIIGDVFKISNTILKW